MSGNLTVLPSSEIAPEDVLAGAMEADLSEVLVMGWNQRDELYVRASKASEANAIMLMELAKHWLLHEVLDCD